MLSQKLQRPCSGALVPMHMTVVDLIKATIACGGIAFLIYSVPQVSQALIIGLLSLVWLSYAYRTVTKLMRR